MGSPSGQAQKVVRPLRRCLILFVGGAALVASCGNDSTEIGAGSTPDGLTAERSVSTADPALAGAAITEFGVDLFVQERSLDPQANLTVSPASVAFALAMVEPGTSGEATEQIRALLRITDPAEFHASMNALDQSLEARVPERFGDDDDPGEVTVRVANAAFLQQGYPFEPTYLDAVGSNYGPVLREVNFAPDPDAVADDINAFVADATNDQIVDLLADGTIQPDTVLALVNALYLKASWLETFSESATVDDSFALFDGTEVDIEMMHGRSGSSASGDGWAAASKPYVGGLRADFILPDEGRFDEITADLGSVLATIDTTSAGDTELALPRFETRANVVLDNTLQALGLTAPYNTGSLLGIAKRPLLVVDTVAHEAFVAMDEEGTEAAAATVVLFREVDGPIEPPLPVVLDRPFLYRIVDTESGATLFIGQVTNPTP